MTPALRRVLFLAAIVPVLLGTASCGDDDSDSASTTSAAKTSSTTAASADDSTDESTDPAGDGGSDAGSGGECGVPTAAVQTALEGNADVLEIGNDGSCGVDVTTSLTKEGDGNAKALAICETASAAAYANGGNSVQVYSPDMDELSISVKGASCIAEP